MLAYGAEERPRRGYVVAAGVGLAALVVGFLVGTRMGAPATPEVAPAAPQAPTDAPTRSGLDIDAVAAGVVTPVKGRPGDFRVSLFNTGSVNVTATVVALPGWAPPLSDTRASTIAPRSWGTVRFSAPPDCLTYPADVRVVHVRLWTDEGVDNRVAPLAEPARALREHYEEMCDPPPTR